MEPPTRPPEEPYPWPTSLDDEAAVLVFSDALQEAGNPWGEVIALMAHKVDHEPSHGFVGSLGDDAAFALRRAREHALGGLARFTLDGQQTLCGRLRLSWRRGFVSHAWVSCKPDPTRGQPTTIADLLRLLAAAPAMRLIDSMVFKGGSPREGCGDILRPWLAQPGPTLRRLVAFSETRAPLGPLDFESETLPNLQDLTLRGNGAGVRIGPLEKLQSLTLFDPSMPGPETIGPLPALREALFSVAEHMPWEALTRFPRLEELEVRGALVDAFDINAFITHRPPALRKLALTSSEVGSAALLRMASITDSKPGALSGLTEISISPTEDPEVWRELQQSLRRAGIRLH